LGNGTSMHFAIPAGFFASGLPTAVAQGRRLIGGADRDRRAGARLDRLRFPVPFAARRR
jgi:hypothetical protein